MEPLQAAGRDVDVHDSGYGNGERLHSSGFQNVLAEHDRLASGPVDRR